MRGVSQEQDIHNLDNRYLVSAHYSGYKKLITNKYNLSEEESSNETVFNKKYLLFYCINFSAAKDIPYGFYIYYHS